MLAITIPFFVYSTHWDWWIVGGGIGVMVSAVLVMIMWTINSKKEQ